MTSVQHQRWIDEGSPWHLAVPILELKNAIEATYSPPADTIGTLGDQSHLDAEPPEDHTPYSETGWPGHTPPFIVTALDYNGPGWEALFEHLINERHAGRMMWIKYINFRGLHHSWEPDYKGTTSTDWKGHGHLSIRTDWCFSSTNLTAAQLTGADATPPAPGPGTPPSASILREKIMTDWQTVRPGSTGQHVKDVQALLNAHGASLIIDGLDGPKTTSALQHFQAEHQVANSVKADGTGDGQAGPQTMLALLDM
jgi:hypothetical protein